MHPVFHVSMLREYMPDPLHAISIQDMRLDRRLSNEEIPIAIIDRQLKKLHSKNVLLVKMIWCVHEQKEAT